MKKIYLVLIPVFFLFQINSFSQFFEDFENGVPGSMTQTYINGVVDFTNCEGNTGGLRCPFSADYSASFYKYTVPPTEITSLETPNLNLTNGVYRLEFDHAQKKRNSDQNNLSVEITTDGGLNYSTIYDFTQEIAVWTHELFYFYIPITSNEVKIRFTALNGSGYAVLLDNILVEEALSIDLGIALNLPSIIPYDPYGTTVIGGSVKNYGIDTVYSFDLSWKDNNGSVHTQTFSNLYIPTNANYVFTHNQAWFITTGFHILEVWISNINANGNDMNATNDQVVLEINAPNQYKNRTPIYEEFTSSTCGPCANFNTNYFNAEFLQAFEDRYVLIKYQMDWPGEGDPYYTEEGNERKIYYNVSGVPSLFLDTEYGAFWDQVLLRNHLINAFTIPSYMELSAMHTLTDADMHVEVAVNSLLQGNYTLHVVVYEKETLLNIGGNGETFFENVMMKMIPDAVGKPISLNIEDPQTFVFDVNLSDTFIEEFDDLGVAVFIQDDSNRMMMQAANSVDTSIGIAEDKMAQFQIYPNPTNNIIEVSSSYEVLDNIKIYTMEGVFVKEIQNASKIDVSNLTSGIYLLQASVDDIIHTSKFIKI